MNLVQRLLALLNTSELLDGLSGMVGESRDATRTGLATAVPAIFGGLIERGSSESGAGLLLKMITQHKVDGGMLEQLSQLFGGRTKDAQLSVGNTMLRAILGEKTDAVARLVGSSSGMSSDSASNLTALAAPAVLAGIAGVAPAGGFSVSSLMALLASQKQHLSADVGTLLGIGGFGVAAASSVSSVSWTSSALYREWRDGDVPRSVAMAEPSLLQLLWPWLVLATLLTLALFGLRACSSPTVQSVAEAPAVSEPAPAELAPAEPAAPEQPATEPAPAQLALPTGSVLSVPPGSVGENLYNFLTSAETGSKTFLFDGLTFDTGSATLSANSQATITAIAEILNAFGTVTVSVDGYTDNVGATESNLALSQARAQAVLAALTAAGVDASRITAAGHGDDKPIADNGTDEGRAQNRRTELTATKN